MFGFGLVERFNLLSLFYGYIASKIVCVMTHSVNSYVSLYCLTTIIHTSSLLAGPLSFPIVGMSWILSLEKKRSNVSAQLFNQNLVCILMHMRWVLEEGHYLISTSHLPRIMMRGKVLSASSPKRHTHKQIRTRLTYLQHHLLPKE